MRETSDKRPRNPETVFPTPRRSTLLGAGLLMLASGSTALADDSLFFAGPSVCPGDIIDIPDVVNDAAGLDPATQETVLESDSIDAPDGSTLVLRGNAQVIQGPQAIFAEEIIYNKDDYSLNARDNVIIYTPGGDRMESAELMLEMETFIGQADTVDFQLGSRSSNKKKRRIMDSGDTRQGAFSLGGMEEVSWFSDDDAFNVEEEEDEEQVVDRGPVRAEMRGEAEKLFFEGQDRQRLQGTRVTSCPEGKDSVLLTASEITLDHASGIGTGKHMTVRFFKVPIFYFPRATFPINDERKTGFLFPSIGASDESGTIVEIPYYINIAPDKDATIYMRYLSDRGVQIMGEYRYLGEKYDGIFRAEGLPGDDVYGDDRYAIGYDHSHRFGEGDRWNARIDVQDVSDAEYFDDFSNDINISSASFLDQRVEVNYNGDIVRFGASAVDYVSIDSSFDDNFLPYGRLPRLTLNAESPYDAGGPFEYGIDSELVRFTHSGDRFDGTRLDATPFVSMPLENVYGYVTPKVSLRYTNYELDNVDPGEETSFDRTVPVFSLDSGVVFERDTSWGDRPHYQTLEPRFFYVYTPYEDQDDIPIFDTGGGNLSNISNYFRESRFFGPDRVGDENRVSLGLTSRIIDSDNGLQRMEAQIAQIFFLEDREVQLVPGTPPDDASESSLLAEVRANLTPRWEVGGSVEYSHEESETEVVRLDTTYHKDDRRHFDISYWYFNDSGEQLDLDATWPLANKWQLGLQTIYDIDEGESLYSSASITYDACCWAARVSGEQRRHRDAEDETAIFFTLELKNLGKFSTYY